MKIKAYDTKITFSDTLTIDGAPADLTDASVKFILALGTDVFSDTATLDADPTSGKVTYQPGVGFPTAVGTYKQEWEVTFADTRKLTFPSDTYNKISIVADLNGE